MQTDAPYLRRSSVPGEWAEHGGAWPSLDAAYVAVCDALNGPVAAWKLGGTNEATRQAFNVSTLYFGPLYTDEVFAADQPMELPLLQTQAEVEIAIRIGVNGFDAWCFAAELPSCPLRNVAASGVATLVADRCGAGALILGPVRRLAEGWSGDITLNIGGAAVARGHADRLIADPIAIAAQFVGLARRYGFAPKQGDWIATGGLTPCVPIPRTGAVTVAVDGRPEFTFSMAAGDRC